MSSKAEGAVLCLVVLIAFSCAQDTRRRERYIAEHPWTPAEVVSAILKGSVMLGMTRAEVAASMGTPVEKNYVSPPRREYWHYEDEDTVVVFLDGSVIEVNPPPESLPYE
jgi:hypothetical protein